MLCTGVFAAYLRNMPTTLYQPDGSVLECFVTGDEYYNWAHDENGFTLVQSQSDGFFYYGVMNGDEVVPSEFLAGSIIPSDAGLTPWAIIPQHVYLEKRRKFWEGIDRINRDAPTHGTVNNINVYIRFSDQTEFSTPRSQHDQLFNKPDGPSLLHYFEEVSYDTLHVHTHHYPICEMTTNLSYQDEYPRSYYMPYDPTTNPNGYNGSNERTVREQTLLGHAIEYIESEVPNPLDIDSNNDGYVDNVTFLVRGSPTAWATLLWPHRSSLYYYNAFINGKQVGDYNFNLEQGGYLTVGVICHEFFHTLGAPDLYHYDGGGAPSPVGGWDIMEANGTTPQYMGAWMKHKYGDWIDCPAIESMGIFPLLPLQSQETSCYRIDSPNSSHEFFVVEYRKQEGIYEVNLPGNQSGMLIYRIDEYLNGNAQGPPDEVYLYRPGGTTTENGNLGAAIFSAETGRTEINDSTDPSSFLYGGAPGGLNIQDIGYPGDIIEFVYWNIFVQTSIVGIANDNDGDGILNPGETAQLFLAANIISAPSNGENVVGTLFSELDWVHFNPSTINFGTLPVNGNTVEIETIISLDDTDEQLMPASFTLQIDADFDDDGIIIHYTDDFDYQLDVTLNQVGFPLSTAEVRSSPLVLDLNNDGDNEIVFGDYNGVVHVYNADGSEYTNGVFPFNTGNQIWGSPAAADLDGDNYLDFVITSKSKHLYIFDYNGLKIDYETEVFLIGTPAIGNLDEDTELEIVFSGYSSDNKIFAINFDGSDLEGFPIDFGEKAKGGVALADFNNNGKDDIVIGTDDDHIYLILDDGSIAPGFPFITGDKVQAAPSILESNGEKIIAAGCNDNHLYVVNSDGSLQFSVLTGDKIQTSPSFIEINGEACIFFGSKDNMIYAVDLNGNSLSGWPVDLENDIVASPCFADFDSDGSPEIVTAINGSDLFVLHIDGTTYSHFPINTQSLLRGAITLAELDSDEDLEIFVGGSTSFHCIDVKEAGEITGMWNMHRGNPERTGFYSSSQEAASVTVEHLNDWNLVGLPMNVEDSYYLTVFPDAVEETLFSFADNYIQESELEPGNGYWLRFDSEGSNIITGVSIPSLTVHLSEDWNLISGITSVVDVNTISDPDELIIPETFFGFSGSYLEVTELEPGQGYWVRSAGEGDITISAGMRAKRREYINHLEGASTLVVNGQTLYFGMDVPDDKKLSYSLPPKPPPGAFDVRFAGDWKYSIDGGEIQLMSTVPTLPVSYNVIDGEEWILTHSEKGIELPLNGSGLLEIPGDISSIVLTRRVEEILPGTFTLKQNYPNPFNPVTEIKYEIPAEGLVSLKVFNILGEEVAVLVNERQPQGNYTATFSAGILPSGVYVYTLESGGYTSVKKCILMK